MKTAKSRGGYWILCLIIIFETVIIALLAISLCLNRKNYSIKFETHYLSDNEEKRTQAEKNSQYDLMEKIYMSMYSSPTDIVFVGDSLTYRCEWNELFPDLNVKNRGIGSDTTEGLLSRVDSIIKTQPSKIFIEIGINDIGQKVEIEHTLSNYQLIINAFLDNLPTAEIYAISVLPVSKTTDIDNQMIKELNEGIQNLCNDYTIVYINLWEQLADEKGFLCELYSLDGVHLTSLGYEQWKNAINQFVYH